MSERLRIALVGATGLIGRALIDQSVGREDVRILAVARREMKLPAGARMEMVVADPAEWGSVFERVRPDVLVSALGTTWNKAGKDEEAFRAVDQHLVLDTARRARASGVKRCVAVSSVGADAGSRNFYLRVKGEVERDLAKIGFDRLDILRPGLLRGQRGGERRIGERLGIIASPLADLLMQGKYRKFRSIRDRDVARAVLAFSMRKAAGKFAHDHDALMRTAKSLPLPQGER
jgi:uncharacterized protein YbjT (DUF2867 family)